MKTQVGDSLHSVVSKYRKTIRLVDINIVLLSKHSSPSSLANEIYNLRQRIWRFPPKFMFFTRPRVSDSVTSCADKECIINRVAFLRLIDHGTSNPLNNCTFFTMSSSKGHSGVSRHYMLIHWFICSYVAFLNALQLTMQWFQCISTHSAWP